jgi:hypothetical protein
MKSSLFKKVLTFERRRRSFMLRWRRGGPGVVPGGVEVGPSRGATYVKWVKWAIFKLSRCGII